MEYKYKVNDTIGDKAGSEDSKIRYYVTKPVGKGGMGQVYQVKDTMYEEKNVPEIVALKVIFKKDNHRPLNEINIISELKKNHSLYYLVDIYDSFINSDEFFCYTMDYIETDLKKWLQTNKDKLSIETACNIIENICDSLIKIHEAKIIHRDIKPSNILVQKIDPDTISESDVTITEGESQSIVCLSDFGVSQKVDADGLITNNIVIGKKDKYKPPEMDEPGNSIDFTVDVYAMAKIAEELFEFIPDGYAKILPVIERATAEYPKDRFQSIQEFINGFKSCIDISQPPSEEIKTKEDKYSFIINEKDEYYFTLDKEGNPIKVGDGTFGVVYKCHNKRNKPFAVKLFYEKFVKIKSESIALNRFRFEIDSDMKIREKLDELNEKRKKEGLNDITFSGLIDNKGGTEKFFGQPAEITFREYFKKLDYHVSNYALVMPLYKRTLKDLLVKGTGKFFVILSDEDKMKFEKDNLEKLINTVLSKEDLLNEIDKNSKGLEKHFIRKIKNENIYEANGYDILKKMDYPQRIATILPILIGIAEGIKTLHLAKMYHLDLKPANIFIGRENDPNKCDLGDLGFLEPQSLKKINESKSSRLPLGTKYYRSPEQIDYFDICDAQVGYDKQDVVLTIRDPKIMDTNIEENDMIVFSKDTNSTAYIIKKIDLFTEKNMAKIVIKGHEENTQLKNKISRDNSTQIILYKYQKVRTDIFGIGAIVFDLLTCGKPPEQFYSKKLSHFDKENESVDNIKQLYIQVSSYQSDLPGAFDYFDAFKDDHLLSYAPSDIVELILKSMLYKAKKTFVCPEGVKHIEGDYHQAIDQVIEELKTLKDKYREYERVDNDLINQILTDIPPSPTKSFKEKFDSLQELNKLSDIPERFAKGVWLLRKLADLIQKSLASPKKGQDSHFFSEMFPENIGIEKSNLSFFYTAYKTEESYKDDLVNNRFITTINRNISNPFVPDSMAFIRRKIHLEVLENNSNNNEFSYYFIDSSLRGDYLQKNDWIIINSKLYKIQDCDVPQRTVQIEIDEFSLSKDSDKTEDNNSIPNIIVDPSEEYVYYAAIEPCKYYLKMLANYIYHIFFVGKINASASKPLLSNLISNYSFLYNQNNFFIQPIEKIVYKHDDNIFVKAGSKEKFDLINTVYSYLYLKLAFTENEHSYYKAIKTTEKDDDVKRILAIINDIDELTKMIETFLGITPGILRLEYSKVEDEINLKKENWSNFTLDFPDFNEIIHTLTGSKFSKLKSSALAKVIDTFIEDISDGKLILEFNKNEKNEDKINLKINVSDTDIINDEIKLEKRNWNKYDLEFQSYQDIIHTFSKLKLDKD